MSQLEEILDLRKRVKAAQRSARDGHARLRRQNEQLAARVKELERENAALRWCT